MRLAYIVKHYRSAVRYDLQKIGVDLAEELKARRFRKLMDLIDEMPPGSHWRAAYAHDPYFIERLEEMDLTKSDFSVPLTEWNFVNEQLATLIDWLSVNANKNNESFKFEPSPRPKDPMGEKAMEVRSKQIENKTLDDIKMGVEMFAPHLLNEQGELKDG